MPISVSIHFFHFQSCNGSYFVSFIQFYQFYTLCSSSLLANIGHFHSNYHPAPTGDHQVFFFCYIKHANKLTGFFGNVYCFYSFTSAVRKTIFINCCSFSKSFFTYHQYCSRCICFLVYTKHAHHFVVCIIHFNTGNADSSSSRWTNFGFRETNSSSTFHRHHDLAFSICHLCLKQLISVINADGIHPRKSWTTEILELRLFDDPPFSA